MIVLDTNVLSEILRVKPDERVLDWIDSVVSDQLSTTAITAAELLYGVGRLPEGRRRTGLTDAVVALLTEDFDGRIEPFDASAATCYAAVVTGRETVGRPICPPDAQIAAICRKLSAPLATRNTRDFEACGIEIFNPWDELG
jgi:toxin FitB